MTPLKLSPVEQRKSSEIELMSVAKLACRVMFSWCFTQAKTFIPMTANTK